MSDYELSAIGTGESLALRGVDASARITGLLATTTLVQKYCNDSKDNLELAYTFPLPVAATLLSFSVAIGERHYQGQVLPRSKAEVDYEKAIGEGNSAFRLQEIQPGMYSATLGNVMAGESVEIRLSYVESLAWTGKSIRYRLPTTIAPRYGEPSGMQPWQRPETDITAEYPLSLTVTLGGALAQSSITCPSHRIAMQASTDSLTVRLAKGATLDRDFILDIENTDIRSLGTQAFARDTHVAMLSLLPPEVDTPEMRRDVVLVIDCSGSMQGDSLDLAREGIQLALGSLAPDERFGIVAFGTRFLQFDKALQPANRKNLDMARRWVKHLESLGGTNIDGALELALKLKTTQAMDVLLLTDGQDWAAGNAIGKAKELGVRIFSMGIGSAVAEDSVRKMADETGGACELVAPTEDMSERIYRHFKRMRQPQMTGLEITWPLAPLWESRPDRACFAGDAYTVFAAMPAPASDSVRVSFDFSGQATQSFDVPLVSEACAADAIVRLAAQGRMKSLAEDEQQAWAVTYQLISDHSDYLITVERDADEKASELPELRVQPQMLPAGWGGTGSVKFSPAVAAGGILQSVDYCHLEVPSVVRRGSTRTEVNALGFGKFIGKLQKRAKRSLLPGLPKTCSDLKKLAPPPALGNLLDRLLADHAETEVLAAFYQALLDHDGNDQLDSATAQEMIKLISNTRPDHVLVVLLVDCLNVLYRDTQRFTTISALRNSGIDRYDIPAFLRKQAD